MRDHPSLDLMPATTAWGGPGTLLPPVGGGQQDEAVRRIEDRIPGPDVPAVREAALALSGALLAAGHRSSYSTLPSAAVAAGQALIALAGPTALDLVLFNLARSAALRFEDERLPAELWPQIERSIARMAARTLSGRRVPSGLQDDVWLKDIAILTLDLLPCVSHLVGRQGGVPRRLALTQPPGPLARSLWFFGRLRGFAPFLDNHVHPDMLEDFNPPGREACYRLVATLLSHWPERLGLTGLSWYYDPAMAQVSPHLAYLREVPQQHRALFLAGPQRVQVTQDATASSATRRRLADEGRYQPRPYLMAWARKDLLAAYGT